MKYQPALDIWTLTDAERAALPIGQWVYAGDPDNKGRFYGQGRSTVVAWHNNGRRIGWKNYCRSLYDYGQTVRNIAPKPDPVTVALPTPAASDRRWYDAPIGWRFA